MGVQLRLWAYDIGFLKGKALSVPVISVGNLTTGGTGKTPVIMALGEKLMAQGLTVVILTRGYGAQDPIPYGRAIDPRFGDEGYLIQRKLPGAIVVIGKNRVSAGEKAIIEYKPDIILLDDGYQHLKLKRTLNILLVDGKNHFGNGQLLPTGPLRESLRQVHRADMIWITKISSDPQVAEQSIQEIQKNVTPFLKSPDVLLTPLPFEICGFESALSGEVLPPETFCGVACVVVSGIAHPQQYLLDLASTGVIVKEQIVFEDHHVYTPEDLEIILASRPSPESPVFTTEKDWVKLELLIQPEMKAYFFTLKTRPVLPDFSQIIDPMLQRVSPRPGVAFEKPSRDFAPRDLDNEDSSLRTVFS
ncbi:MAG: tetraacyldisaccharide 4'-kinase [Cyanobacteria bacterium]|nr:tetraacyldisaccharide 4'-kinase [Cyanobacteriota bacterium]